MASGPGRRERKVVRVVDDHSQEVTIASLAITA
jgi:hypothetical protein